MAELHGKK
eukprot:gene27235-35966_t